MNIRRAGQSRSLTNIRIQAKAKVSAGRWKDAGSFEIVLRRQTTHFDDAASVVGKEMEVEEEERGGGGLISVTANFSATVVARG
jgi:hypothetical protein